MNLDRFKPNLKLKSNKLFNHITLPTPPKLTQHNTPSGRYYTLPTLDKRYYSVTTVLHHMTEDIITEWKNNVGDEVAKRQGAAASQLGTMLHTLSEHYLKNEELEKHFQNNLIMYHRFKAFSTELDNLDNIHCLEVQMYSEKLGIAGTVDCIAEYKGKLSIIDFKTSKKLKHESDIAHYFAQASAYAIMAYERFGLKISQVCIMISVENESPLVYTANVKDYVPVLLQAIKTFKEKLNG